jgi:hypothetical protein
MAGDEVDMEVGHALGHAVVHGHEAPVGPEAALHSGGDAPGVGEERLEEIVGELGEGGHVAAGDEEGVAGEDGAMVEEGQGVLTLQDDMGGLAPFDDVAEPAVAHSPSGVE